MNLKILLICEDPTENRRKMWAAEYDGDGVVKVSWGRIGSGYAKTPINILRYAKQTQAYPFDNDDKALAFIDKKVKEKASKNYQTVLYEHDGLPITFLCDRQPDDNGFVKMETWNGKK